jgi:predicted RNase H-like HicB family nuclease
VLAAYSSKRTPDPELAPMTASIQLSVIFEPVENGWVQARIEELPGVITAAPTRDEARSQVIDALREYLLALRDLPSSPAIGVEREAVDVLISS